MDLLEKYEDRGDELLGLNNKIDFVNGGVKELKNNIDQILFGNKTTLKNSQKLIKILKKELDEVDKMLPSFLKHYN